MTDDISQRGEAWPSPRIWDYASRLIAAAEQRRIGLADALPLLAGCVGEGAALELAAWARDLDLPDPEDLLAHPERYRHPDRGDQAYAIISAVCQAAIGDLTPERWLAAWTVLASAASAGSPDVAAAAARSLDRERYGGLPLPTRQITPFIPVLEAAGLLRGGRTMDAETKLGAAVLVLQRQHPYLAAALWAVRRVRAPGLGTMGVDAGWRLFYDPSPLGAWEVEEVSGVVYHELCHLLRDHAGRASFAERKDLWNLAADAEINDDLRAEAVTLPDGAIYPWSFEQPTGRLAEEYYRALLKHEAPPAQSGRGAGCCGGAATGILMDGVVGSDALPKHADAALRSWRMPPPIGAGEQEVIRRRVARGIDDHRKSAGSVPSHLARWAADRLEPRVDWRRELASLVRWGVADASGMVDYSYRRPSRRQTCVG